MDLLFEKAQQDPRVARIVSDARLFIELQETEAWKRLYETFQETRTSVMLKLVRRLMAGHVVDQREIDFHRGFYNGVRAVLERPGETVEALEAAAERAWMQERDEQADQGEEPIL